MAMQELKLKKFNWSIEGSREILQDLYKLVLNYDPHWHFFWEGSYTLLRVSAGMVRQVEQILNEHEVEFERAGKWEDNIWVTKKYQSIFKEMFHSFSVMALELDISDLEAVFDRVVHCFLNMCNSKELRRLMEAKYGEWANLWEPYLAGEYCARRAFTWGRISK